MRIGFIGAGQIGQALARLAVASGHTVMLSNSRGPASLTALAANIGGTAARVEDTAAAGDLLVVTIPFAKVFTLAPGLGAGKVLIDTNNYYPQRDGRFDGLDRRETTTSGLVAGHFATATVVKAFNAILAADLVTPVVLPAGRRALPIAGDDLAAKQLVAELQDGFGFATVDAGPLSESWRFERAKPAYCMPLDRIDLIAALAHAERGVELPHGSWRR